ncbi:hypothetical protein BG015_011583 [Linnemannia schmuckeri]|uniref:Transmembrane protein n=1 Tax=Linnemannia schmuckeri TaxID=64567 RepID=A0A9P5RV59_9FUNG|nr:hypothetical protein BG015_011583 [Linnemannia schmuckeri]
MPPTTTSGMSVSPPPSPSPSPSSSTRPSSSPHTTLPVSTTTFDAGYPTSRTQTARPAPTATDSSPSVGGAFGPGGVPVATIFYFVAFVVALIAIIYTIHRVRRNRRRRLQEQNGDSESGGRTRHTSTYRPEDDEGCPPPQYRAYAADEPSLDPEMTIIYPEQAHYASSHLGLLSFTPALSSPTADNDDSVNPYLASSRPPLHTNSTGTTTTTTTTTITTTTTTTSAASGSSLASPSASPTITQRSIMAPNANILTTTPLNSADRLDQYQHQYQHQEQQHGSHMSSVPVISAPSPAFTFTVSRHLPILRNGLAGSNNIHQSGLGRRSTTPPVSNSTGTGGIETTNNQLSTPDMQSVSQIHSPNRNSFAGSISSTGSGSGSQSGLVVVAPQQQHPVLNRLRSQGPPPYIPVPPEAALPRLPPEYDTAIAPTFTTTTTTTAITPGSS